MQKPYKFIKNMQKSYKIHKNDHQMEKMGVAKMESGPFGGRSYRFQMIFEALFMILNDI